MKIGSSSEVIIINSRILNGSVEVWKYIPFSIKVRIDVINLAKEKVSFVRKYTVWQKKN